MDLILSDGVDHFDDKGARVSVQLKSGKSVEVDMVLLSIGVRPETKLAAEAGLKIGVTRGIWVNEYMQTSHPDIYALGDAVEIIHGVTGKPAMIPLAGPANKQGRIVADNLVLGNKSVYKRYHRPGVQVPIESIEQGIRKATVCLADITEDNPNVWYELGLHLQQTNR